MVPFFMLYSLKNTQSIKKETCTKNRQALYVGVGCLKFSIFREL